MRRERWAAARNIPVVCDADDNFRLLSIDDIDEVISEEFPTELVVVGRLGRAAVSKTVWDDEPVALGFEVSDLAGPVERTGGEAVNEE